MNAPAKTVFDRAQEAAANLLGTCNSLESEATEEELNDSEFCAALDSEVMQCGACGWWVESHEINDEGNCAECDPEED